MNHILRIHLTLYMCRKPNKKQRTVTSKVTVLCFLLKIYSALHPAATTPNQPTSGLPSSIFQ